MARAQKERDEMIESKQRELEQDLNELNSDSFSDEEMDGSPAFLEPLKNSSFQEGNKFQLSCSIAGFPQPKVRKISSQVEQRNCEFRAKFRHFCQNSKYLPKLEILV